MPKVNKDTGGNKNSVSASTINDKETKKDEIVASNTAQKSNKKQRKKKKMIQISSSMATNKKGNENAMQQNLIQRQKRIKTLKVKKKKYF